MRLVIQRVKKSTVTINNSNTRSIQQGLLILCGIEESDDKTDIEWLTKKVTQLRIFSDKDDIMNLSVQDINGEIMLISQFTLHAKTKKGNRPSYIKAASPDIAIPIYEAFKTSLQQELKKDVITGEFGAHMDIELVNDGPVTIIIDSKNRE